MSVRNPGIASRRPAAAVANRAEGLAATRPSEAARRSGPRSPRPEFARIATPSREPATNAKNVLKAPKLFAAARNMTTSATGRAKIANIMSLNVDMDVGRPRLAMQGGSFMVLLETVSGALMLRPNPCRTYG